MEENFLFQYKSIEDKYPIGDFQESGTPCPQHLFEGSFPVSTIVDKWS